MHAATQHFQGTIAAVATHQTWRRQTAAGQRAVPSPMLKAKPRQFFIQGVTLEGRAFRPSDWAERLAGAMSSFRPGGGVGGIAAYIGYSPYCFPQLVAGVKCVVVDESLKDFEPMAWDFVMNFARDNRLQVGEACVVGDAPPRG